jgi:hypothetical protein
MNPGKQHSAPPIRPPQDGYLFLHREKFCVPRTGEVLRFLDREKFLRFLRSRCDAKKPLSRITLKSHGAWGVEALSGEIIEPPGAPPFPRSVREGGIASPIRSLVDYSVPQVRVRSLDANLGFPLGFTYLPLRIEVDGFVSVLRITAPCAPPFPRFVREGGIASLIRTRVSPTSSVPQVRVRSLDANLGFLSLDSRIYREGDCILHQQPTV